MDKAADMVGAARRFLVSRTVEPITTGPSWSCGIGELVTEIAATAPQI